MKSAFSIATLCAASSAVLIQSEPVLDMANPLILAETESMAMDSLNISEV